MIQINGANLTLTQRQQVLALYVHRHTTEHPYQGNMHPPVPAPETDAQWLARHMFWIKKNGDLAYRACEVARVIPTSDSQTLRRVRRVYDDWSEAGNGDACDAMEAIGGLLSGIEPADEGELAC